MTYFERTGKLGPKIDLYGPTGYLCSTNWHKRCRDAVDHWRATHPDYVGRVYGRFAKKR